MNPSDWTTLSGSAWQLNPMFEGLGITPIILKRGELLRPKGLVLLVSSAIARNSAWTSSSCDWIVTAGG
jgi:hypothetical protein